MSNPNSDRDERVPMTLDEIRKSVSSYIPATVGASLMHGYAIRLIALLDNRVSDNQRLAEDVVNSCLCAEQSGNCEESVIVHKHDLLRSIAALPKPQWNALCQRHRDGFNVFHVGGCLTCWNNSERQSAATRMRDRCADRVKVYLRHAKNVDVAPLIDDLQSLMLEGEPEKSK